MTFKLDNFCLLGGEGKSKPAYQLFAYKSTDTIDEITSINYFREVKEKFSIDNVILFFNKRYDGTIENGFNLYFLKISELNIFRDEIKADIIDLQKEASTTIPLSSTENGEVGTSTLFARGDHRHIQNKSSETIIGEIQIATEAEAIDGTDNTKAITPLNLKKVIETLGQVVKFKGGVETFAELPTNNEVGDVWYVKERLSNFIWIKFEDVYQWEEFGVDLTPYFLQDIGDEESKTMSQKFLTTLIKNKSLSIWDERIIYNIDELVIYNSLFFKSLSNDNLNNNPITSEDWEELKLGGGGGNNSLGEIKNLLLPSEDVNLTRMLGQQIAKGGVHNDFYNHMETYYNTIPDRTYYKYQLSSDFVIYGSLLRDNFTFSGFSSTNYISIPSFKPTAGQTFNFEVNFRTGDDVSSNQYIIRDNPTTNFIIWIVSGRLTIRLNPITGSERTLKSGITANTDYKVKVEFDGVDYKFYVNEELVSTLANTSPITMASDTLILGNNNTQFLFGGTITIFDETDNTDLLYYTMDGVKTSFVDITAITTKSYSFCNEDEYNEYIAVYGECGYFVYNESYIKLPTINGYLKGVNNIYDLGKIEPININGVSIDYDNEPKEIINGYIAEENGLVYIVKTAAQGQVKLFVNEKEVDSNNSNTSNEGGGLSAYVNKNDVITWTGDINNPKFFKNRYKNNILNIFQYLVIGTTTKTSIQFDIEKYNADLEAAKTYCREQAENAIFNTAPDRKAGVPIQYPYEAKADGVICPSLHKANGTISLIIDGGVVAQDISATTQYFCSITGEFRISAGQIAEVSGNPDTSLSNIFYPLNGNK